MTWMPIVLSQRHVRATQKAFRVAAAIVGALVAVTTFRLWSMHTRTQLLATETRNQNEMLANLTQSARSQPPSATPANADGDPLARLQSALEAATEACHCTIEEFQASPERTPYLSAFTQDTKEPDWLQIPIHVTLKGKLPEAFEAIERLRKAQLPLEPDSIEISRDGPPSRGSSIVSLRLGFRILVRAEGKA